MVNDFPQFMDAFSEFDESIRQKVMKYITDRPRIASSLRTKVKNRTPQIAWQYLEEKVPMVELCNGNVTMYEDLKESINEYFQ